MTDFRFMFQLRKLASDSIMYTGKACFYSRAAGKLSLNMRAYMLKRTLCSCWMVLLVAFGLLTATGYLYWTGGRNAWPSPR
jgi:hypothetical protein